MDQIIIENLEIFGYHGVFEEEAFLGQKFIVDARLYLDTRPAGQTDDLTQSLDYGEVCQFIKKLVETERYMLIEKIAEEIASGLLLTYDLLQKVEITVKKPWAPVRVHLDTVAVRIERGWHTVYLSIGSNMGDKEGYLDFAIDRLNALPDTKVTEVSDYIETEPYGDVEQDNFLNGALKIQTLKSPEELLDTTMAIEQEAHRERIVHWGPRTLDLDLLFYDDQILGTKRLIVPHPEIEKRSFVLVPMAQIAPWLRHPVSKSTIKQLLEELNAEQ